MGILHAKCEQCWDPIPCFCPAQQERNQAIYPAITPEALVPIAQRIAKLEDERDELRDALAVIVAMYGPSTNYDSAEARTAWERAEGALRKAGPP